MKQHIFFRKITLILSYLFFFSLLSNAQLKVITGTILNTDKTPEESILISFQTEEKTIQTTQTDTLGNYSVEINLPPNGCKIIASSWGNILYQDTIYYTTQNKIRKDIQLNTSSSIQMDEVLVEAVRKGLVIKGSKLVYTPKETMLKSNTVFDILRQTPLIHTQDDAISLITKEGTLIYINGRQIRIPIESLIENLKTMPSDNLKNIEIITNPGAEYEASSTGGVINIILKKNFDEGFWGQILAQDIQGRKNSQYISPTLRYRKGNFGIDGSVSLNNNNGKVKTDNRVEMKNTGDGQYSTSTDRYKSKSINVNLNAEYELNEQHSLNLISMLRFAKPKTISDMYTYYYNVYTNTQNDSITNTKANDKGSTINSYFFSLNYMYTIDEKGQKLSLSGDYMNYSYTKDHQTSMFSVLDDHLSPRRNISSFTPQKIASYSFKADYTLPIKNNFFNAGMYYSYNRNKTSYTEIENTVVNTNTNSNFLYDEYLAAAYAQLSRTWNEHLYTSLGLRAEYMRTKRDLKSLDSDHWSENKINLFPSLNIGYQMNQRWSLNYSLTNKVQRPDFWQLNPTIRYINNNLYALENPFLRNTYITTQELSFTLNYTYYFAIGYNYAKNATSQLMLPDAKESNVNFYNRYNYGNVNNLSLVASLPFQFFANFWSGNATLETDYVYYIYTDKKLRQYYSNNGSWLGVFMLNNTFALSEKNQLWAYLNFYYVTPSREVYKRNVMNAPAIDIELKKNWDNWSLSLKVNSLLNNKSTSKVLHYETSPYLRNGFSINAESRVIELRVAYSFGNSKTRKNRESQLANDEVRGRVQ